MDTDTKLNREEWINAVYLLFCKSQGEPQNANEEKNLREWAALLADGECDYYKDGYTPRAAHDEELSCL